MVDLAQWWIENVLLGAIRLSYYLADLASDSLGDYAGFVVLALMFPVFMVGSFIGLFATGTVILAALLLSPLILPITIYNHIKNK